MPLGSGLPAPGPSGRGLFAAGNSVYVRVRLQLNWPTVTEATITRVHADGTSWPVRDGDAVTVRSAIGVGWVGYDHEAPLDAPFTYRATSPQSVASYTSAPVTLASGGKVWLTHPLRPSLARQVVVRDLTPITYPARRGSLDILGRPEPIVRTNTRGAGQRTLTVQTDTLAELRAMRILLADGAVLQLRLPATWAGDSWYVAIGDVVEDGYMQIADRPERRWVLPLTSAARPAGHSEGPVGITWADVAAMYPTWAALAAANATWNDLMVVPGP